MITNSFSPQEIALALRQGNLVVLKTDTIYGITAQASNPDAFHKLYRVRKRPLTKPSILLIADIEDIPSLTPEQRKIYKTIIEERPTTLINSVDKSYFPHLPRNNNTLAFRVVKPHHLKELIRLTGPILAPSANLEGLTPATTIDEAVEYFGDGVSLYVDEGKITQNTPSRIVSISNGVLKIVR